MAGATRGVLDQLSATANRVVADNAQKLSRLTGADLTPEQRARRVWDIPAKMQVARRIADEELARAGPGAHNDVRDARRHARWSQRTAEAAGPVFAEAAGLAHEAENFLDSVRAHGLSGPYDRRDSPHSRGMPPTPGETVDEIGMDLRNNAEGRRAAREGREIDPRRLQTEPRTAMYTALYRMPRSGVTSSARR